MKKYLGLFILILSFVSCSDIEYGYNEKMASEFYNTKENVDELYVKFKNGDFDTLIENSASMDFKLKDIEGAKSVAEETVTFLQQHLKPSEIAKDFHESNLKYYDIVISDFTENLKNYYIEKGDKSTLKAAVIASFSAIETQQDLLLEKQLIYIEKAGMKPNLP